jgi:dolichol-phosphate mannosyltransferase
LPNNCVSLIASGIFPSAEARDPHGAGKKRSTFTSGACIRPLTIIPTYNERENLPRLVPALLSKEPALEVLVVDDASPDGTGDIAESLARETGRVRVLHRKGKLGLGTAYVAGFEYALHHGYDPVVQMDADFSHRPEDMPRLLRAAQFADVVIGSRNIRGGQVENWSLLRRYVSKGGSLCTRSLLGLPIRDCTSGFKCFRREVLKTIDFESIESHGYAFQVEMNYLCHRIGFCIVEVPIVFPDRTAGRSKMSMPIVLEAAGLVWKLRSRRFSLHSEAASTVGSVLATDTNQNGAKLGGEVDRVIDEKY